MSYRNHFLADQEAFNAETQAGSSPQETIASLLVQAVVPGETPTAEQVREIVKQGFRSLESSRSVLTWSHARLYYLRWDSECIQFQPALEAALETARQERAKFSQLIAERSGLTCSKFRSAAQALHTAIEALLCASPQ
jgi:hypothetical protein